MDKQVQKGYFSTKGFKSGLKWVEVVAFPVFFFKFVLTNWISGKIDMAFFSGEYDCTVDAKGRMVLPARIKAHLPEIDGGGVVLTRGFETCIVLYSQTEFKKIYSKVAGLNEFSEEYRVFQRNFFRGINEAELDGNGRLLIPKTLMTHAQLEKDLTVVGMGNRVEIWSPSLYEQYLIKDSSEFARLAEKYLAGNKKE